MQSTVNGRSLADWVDAVLIEYHRPLPGELALLDELVAAIAGASPARVRIWEELRDDLVAHVAKEERVLFPWIRSGRGASAGAPIQVMLYEHRESLAVMSSLAADARNQLAGGDEASRRWAAAYLAFDARLREHMRVEEQELFQRALVEG